jgi:hypothetical protein
VLLWPPLLVTSSIVLFKLSSVLFAAELLR